MSTERFSKPITFDMSSLLEEYTQNASDMLANPVNPTIKSETVDTIIKGDDINNKELKDIRDNNPNIPDNSIEELEHVESFVESLLLEAEGDEGGDEPPGGIDNTGEDTTGDNNDEGNNDTDSDNPDTDNANEDDSEGEALDGGEENPDDMSGDGGDDGFGDDSGGDDGMGEDSEMSIEEKIKNSAIIDDIISTYKNLEVIKTRISTFNPINQTEKDTFNALTNEINNALDSTNTYLDFKAYKNKPKDNYSFLLKMKGIIESTNKSLELLIKSRENQ